ncbi:hypothetical protein Psal011_02260 [Piscirickettsia salmonis]|uniref:hypothetical protein n=1 Tax=Piscirickettsia salmonis TaxID=1238 RepID=UPI0012B806C1|nr:hypothetical protein [Piscirickettsia salmonis]QGO17042.1 hypothetical protein Psal011_02260 [Piscirickettsia salmonis]
MLQLNTTIYQHLAQYAKQMDLALFHLTLDGYILDISPSSSALFNNNHYYHLINKNIRKRRYLGRYFAHPMMQNRRAKRDDYKPSAVRVTQRYVP